MTGLIIDGVSILNSKSEYVPTSNGVGGFYSFTHNIDDYAQGIGDVSSFTGSNLPSVGASVATMNIYDAELLITPANKGFNGINIYTLYKDAGVGFEAEIVNTTLDSHYATPNF